MCTLETLFSPFKIGTLELRNRIVMGPMGTNLSNPDGTITEEQIGYYEARARGGVGLIITEMAVVDPIGRYQPRIPEISNEKQIEGWKKLVKAVHVRGAKIVIQLGHAGRETVPELIGGARPVAPSPIPAPHTKIAPKELTIKEIKELINRYAEAAERAVEAGVDGIEVHGAHCYLMAGFMSPLTNKRSDAYGGGLDGRLRFPVEVVGAIRERVGPGIPILFRISADEMVPGGLGFQETKIICRMLVEAGVEAIEISRGSLTTLRWVVPPAGTPIALNLSYASELKKIVDVPILVVGRINDPRVAEEILKTNQADLIVMSRALLADPDLPKKAHSKNRDEIVPCIACNQCLSTVMGGNILVCSVNPFVGKEKEIHIAPAKRKKKVLVVGGGPAGMEAARVAKLRGHEVTLYDKASRLGGQLLVAAVPRAKQELVKLIKYFSFQINKLGVKVELEREVTEDLVSKLHPDVVVLATGSRPIIPDIPGMSNKKVTTAIDVLAGKVAIGNKAVIIGGGMVGCETADYLAEMMTDVVLLEEKEEIAEDMVIWQREFLLERLAAQGVRIFTSVKVKEIIDNGIVFVKGDKEEEILNVDNIVLAAGATPAKDLLTGIKEKVREVYTIGDASRPRKVLDAIREGTEVGLKI